MEMIPLVDPCYTNVDRDEIGICLGNWSLFDEKFQVEQFEEEFAAYVGCVGGVAVNSGTNALIVALEAWGVAETHSFAVDVSMPSYTCRALLDAASAIGVEPELYDNHCDVARAQFSLKVEDVTAGDVVVVPHMFGTDANLGFVEGLIDDITLSLGAVQSPHIGVCSFHRDKMISTGRGGVIVSQDTGFLERCRELAYYDTALLSGSERNGVQGEPATGVHSAFAEQRSDPESNGYRPAFSFGMSGMQAALGRSQLRQLPWFIERRKEIAARYTEVFSQAGMETPDSDVQSVFFRYIVGVRAPDVAVRRLADLGVECGRGVDPPLHRLLGLPPKDFPGAEECYSKLLSVPVHPSLTDEQVAYITEQVLATCAP